MTHASNGPNPPSPESLPSDQPISFDIHIEGPDAEAFFNFLHSLPDGPPPKTLVSQIVDTRESWLAQQIPTELGTVLKDINFIPVGDPLLPRHDSIPFYKKVAGGIELYRAKHNRYREKGKNEAAEAGIGKIGNQEVAVFAMHYDFMGGSMGSVVGEEYMKALELASDHKIPMVCIYTSGGARQDENTKALYQMERVVAGIEHVRIKTPDVPIVSVLFGEVWGGVTASAMPRGDLRVGILGSRMGFAGTRVIESVEGRKIDPNQQRIEAHALLRHVDVLVEDLNMMNEYLKEFFEANKKPKDPFDYDLLGKTAIIGPKTGQRFIEFTDDIVAPPITKQPKTPAFRFAPTLRSEPSHKELFDAAIATGKSVEEADTNAKGNQLDERYRNLLFDVARPDTVSIMQQGFKDTVPLYNQYFDAESQTFVYPNIVAGIGKIGLQPFMIIGDQPSYAIKDGNVVKRFASPTPNDMRSLVRMINLGNRLHLPLALFTDTPGAEASIKSEQDGQFDDIANVLAQYPHYNQPILSVIHGLQGSGGGLITSPQGDSLAMTSRALMSVAEPGSASVIIYGANATPSDRIHTLLALGADAQSQLRDGMIDTIIPEHNDPYQTIGEITDHIAKTYMSLSKIRSSALRDHRWKRLKFGDAFKVDRH